MKTFSELGLSPELVESIQQMGFEEATPIQEQTIPIALEGKDVLGQAQTGTGKTAAFGIPMVEQFDVGEEAIQGIVITPTRELAVQVAEELNRIGQKKRVRAVPIYGGQEITRQIRSLKKRPHIIVGTPGRLQDHIRRKTIRLQDIKMVVLDEADEMLNMGFIEEIEAILSEIPENHQTLLFSATMAPPIKQLAGKFMVNPHEIKIKVKEVTMPTIDQSYIEVTPKKKFDVLCNLLDIQSPELAIIFGRTKKRVDELADALSTRGYSAEGIHGDLSQARRDTVIRRFKEGLIEIMVATDVAARGLDISGVTHVYNLDIPQDAESYVHRIGRTGRAGNTGIAVTFVNPREIDLLRSIERMTKKKIRRQNLPTFDDALEGQKRLASDRLLKVVEEGGYQAYKDLAMELLEESESVDLVAAALKMVTKEPSKKEVTISKEVERGGGRRPSGRKREHQGKGSRPSYRKGKRR